MVIMVGMVFAFGNIGSYWDKSYTIGVHFTSAPGVVPSAPVKMNGIVVGTVRDIHFDQKRGGAMVLIDMKTKYALRADSQPRIVRSLLGDSSIEFDPGTSEQMLAKGVILEGTLPVDPMMLIADLNAKMSTTLESFASTSHEWQNVARNLSVSKSSRKRTTPMSHAASVACRVSRPWIP